MKRITRIIRPIICMVVLLFAMTTAVMGCYCHPQMQLKQETIQNAFACIKMTRTAFYQCGFDFYMSFSA